MAQSAGLEQLWSVGSRLGVPEQPAGAHGARRATEHWGPYEPPLPASEGGKVQAVGRVARSRGETCAHSQG